MVILNLIQHLVFFVPQQKLATESYFNVQLLMGIH